MPVIGVGRPLSHGAPPVIEHEPVGLQARSLNGVDSEGVAFGELVSPASAACQAGRIMLRRLEELARSRADFAFESTVTGRSAPQLLARLDRGGYEVHILYLWLASADLAVERVRGRVDAGEHDVPDRVIRRRFTKSIGNFDRLYRPIATTWRLFDGVYSAEGP